MQALTVEYCALAQLTPYASNPRSHSKKQIAQIRASIEAHGFTNPILTDEAGSIIAGHGRYLAAQSLGLEQVPVIRLVDLSEAKKRALRIADNKIALESAWSPELLQIEIQGILDLQPDFTIEVIGFSTGEIDVILDPKGLADTEEDVVPTPPRQATSRPGDIWMLGPHRIGCGDCGDREFLRRVVGGDLQVDAAFLDPPYNLKVDGNLAGRGRHREFLMGSGEMTDTEFETFLKDRLSACASVSKNGAVHFVCIDHRHVEHMAAAGAAVYNARLNICVWVKSTAGMGSLYRSRHELVFVFRVGEGAHYNAVELGRHGRNRSNCWEHASANSPRGDRRRDLALHPTVKPVGLVSDAIKDVTRRGEQVLDAFLGSGTTLLGCERTGRICRGVELDPIYVDVALERWLNVTGGEAIEESTGESFRARQRALHAVAGA